MNAAGKVIGKEGISADSVKGLTLSAGDDYTIKNMNVKLGRNGALIMEAPSVPGNWPFWETYARPGDIIAISVQEITRTNASGKEESVDVGTVVLKIPVH